jgi:ABC-type glycerol-3-phosphate transport system substrate-binding protein
MISRQCAGINLSSNLVMTLRLNDPSTDWRVAPIAAIDAEHKPLNFAGGSALMIPSTSRYPKEALDFMTWLTSEGTQRLKYGLEAGPGRDFARLFQGV